MKEVEYEYLVRVKDGDEEWDVVVENGLQGAFYYIKWLVAEEVKVMRRQVAEWEVLDEYQWSSREHRLVGRNA